MNLYLKEDGMNNGLHLLLSFYILDLAREIFEAAVEL